MLLIFPVFFVLYTFCVKSQFYQIATNCPIECNCTELSDQCTICYQKVFKRQFILILNQIACPCILGFSENYPPRSYCCANNCTSCYDNGCYSCRSNWTLTVISTWNICLCKLNFYFDTVLNDCLCLLQQSSTNLNKYYEPSRSQCYPCPNNCSCDARGCFFCNFSTNRIIGLSSYDISTCFCIEGYIENNGNCISSIDYNITTCEFPTILEDGFCICKDPYYLDKNGNCICRSIINSTGYYQYKNICYWCPVQCKCNELGCYYCSPYSKRIVLQNHCSCNFVVGTIGFIETKGLCQCISPYDSDTCYCNSFNYPNLFYLDQYAKCKVCPKECTCGVNGCASCASGSNRDKQCNCIPPFIQLDGKCNGCSSKYIYKNGTCLCPNTILPSLFYDDDDQEICHPCPIKCICDQTGCFSCNSTTNRILSVNSQHVKICYCNTLLHFQENKLGICQCIAPYIYNLTSQKCFCPLPYTENNKSECLCPSNILPTAFYVYQGNICRVCPNGCICSTRGCISCNSTTGRVIMFSSNFITICPCLPIRVVEPTGNCIQCYSNQYVWKNECFDCNPNCVTCNEVGCTSCSIFTFLQQNTCVCTSNDKLNNIYNHQGRCICTTGYYNMSIINQSCLPCPFNCKNCQFNPLVEDMVMCIACNVNVFRVDDPLRNCPCKDYYIEGINIYPYCCHWSCMDCNAQGCISCLPLTFRYLDRNIQNNVTCSCQSGFVESYSNICQCPPETYLYIGECLPCPSYCASCNIVNNLINCSCHSGFNRVEIEVKYNSLSDSDYYDCLCLTGFELINNYSSFCYPVNCEKYSDHGTCTKCQENRRLTQNGLSCLCKEGFYEDSDSICQLCSEGCISCLTIYVCLRCAQNFFLISDKMILSIRCIIPDNSLSILTQIRSQNIYQVQLKQPLSIEMLEMYIIPFGNKTQANTMKISVLDYAVTDLGVLIIRFLDLEKSVYAISLIYVNGSFLNSSSFGLYFLLNRNIYKNTELKIEQQVQRFILSFVIIVMCASLILHFLGAKINEIMYWLQTIYFISMQIYDKEMIIVPALNYLRISTFRFSLKDSGIPFNGLVDWQTNIQFTQGNYEYYSVDNNLLRNAGLPFFLIIINSSVIIGCRLLYLRFYNSKISEDRILVKKYQKYVYRIFEWIHKSMIYPVVFFAWSTIILRRRQYSLINENLRLGSFGLAITIIIAYHLINLWQYWYDSISKMYKYDGIIQSIFNSLTSVIIVHSYYSPTIFFLVPIVLIRSSLQLWNQYNSLRIFTVKKATILLILNLIQCFMLFPIYYLNRIGTIVMLLTYLLGIIVFRIYILMVAQCDSKYEMKKRELNKEDLELDESVKNLSYV